MRLPCKDCITLAICRATIKNFPSIYSSHPISALFEKCELLQVYIKLFCQPTDGGTKNAEELLKFFNLKTKGFSDE